MHFKDLTKAEMNTITKILRSLEINSWKNRLKFPILLLIQGGQEENEELLETDMLLWVPTVVSQVFNQTIWVNVWLSSQMAEESCIIIPSEKEMIKQSLPKARHSKPSWKHNLSKNAQNAIVIGQASPSRST